MNSLFARASVEDLGPGPAANAAGDGRDGSYQGYLNSVPSGGRCLVVIEALDPLHQHETYCRTDATGSVGDLVLVTFDERKQLWLTLNLGRNSL